MQDDVVVRENRSRTVVVADDNREVNFVIKEMLGDYGYEVHQAFDGEEAIQRFKDIKPDLMLLDYRMPQMDGIDALKEIKRFDQQALVVFMTGEGSEDVAVQAMKAGAEDYITKPIDFPALIDLAAKLIKEHDMLVENIRLKARGDAYKNYLVTITQTMGEAVITTTDDGRIEFMNAMARKLWGNEDEMKNQTIDVIFHDSHKEIFTDIKNTLIEGMEHFETECTFQRKDESTFSGLLTASPLNRTFYKGETVLVVRDLTDVEEMRRQIINAEKMASLGKVVEGVAHEIRNSLTSLGGFSRRLEKSLAPESDQRTYVNYIIEDVKRLETMTQDIEEYVNYTKIHKPCFEPAHIEDIIDEALAKTFGTGKFSGVKYIINELEESEPILADRNYLVEAFWHLFKNAGEAMEGNGTLVISLSLNPSYLIVDVMDSGRGIPHEEIKEIFNPFFTSKVQGAGVGLSKVYMIIEEHRGYISVKSIMGKGTRMRVYLPRIKKTGDTTLPVAEDE